MARAKSGVRTLFQPYCKCGWEGAKYCGKDSRAQAWEEYRYHKTNCIADQENRLAVTDWINVGRQLSKARARGETM